MKIWNGLKYAGGLLLDGYAVCVALIMAWPHAAFWLIAALVVFAVL